MFCWGVAVVMKLGDIKGALDQFREDKPTDGFKPQELAKPFSLNWEHTLKASCWVGEIEYCIMARESLQTIDVGFPGSIWLTTVRGRMLD